MCSMLAGWGSTTRTCRGRSSSAGCPTGPGARTHLGRWVPTVATVPPGRRCARPTRRRLGSGAGPTPGPTPSSTATRTSASSTAPARPRSWPRRRPASAWRRWPSPTTTASTASCASPRPQRALGVPTVFGAELSLGLTRPQNGQPDPEGSHLLVLARDPEGYASLASTISAAQLAGAEKGKPVYDGIAFEEVHRDHWLVLTGCRKGSVPARPDGRRARRPRPASWTRWSPPSVGTTWPWSCATTATRSTRPATTRSPRWPWPRASTWWPPPTRTTPRPRRRLATAMAAVRARRSLDEIDGWLPGAAGAHLRSGDEQARRFARWPGAVDAGGRARSGLRVRPAARGAEAAAVPVPRRPQRDGVPPPSH